jgi:hypothetical protein
MKNKQEEKTQAPTEKPVIDLTAIASNSTKSHDGGYLWLI